MFVLTTESRAPEGYKTLLWDVFFVSRGRGLTLAQHFPWLDGFDANCWFVIAWLGADVVGGLCVKKAADEIGEVASLGLVCITPAHRGKRLSTSLIERAVAEAETRALAALRLWTGKPEVYQGQGFRTADNAQYGWIVKPHITVLSSVVAVTSEEWPDAVHRRRLGLPAFACRGRLWRSAVATVTTLEDEGGMIVAEWSGETADVIRVLEQVLPERARLNALVDDELPAVLRQRGWDCTLVDSQLQMILPLASQESPQQLARLHTPRILRRI